MQTVDFIGVVTEPGSMTSINLKSGDKRDKKTLIVADDDGLDI